MSFIEKLLGFETAVSTETDGFTVVTCEACKARNRVRQQRTTGRVVCKACKRSLLNSIVVLVDVSTSMREQAGAKSKIEIVREALADILPKVGRHHLLAFSSTVSRIEAASYLPSPSGSTALHLGLIAAANLVPKQTIVISDGYPDDENRALAALDLLTGTVDVLYIGPDSEKGAIAFMNRLARRGDGNMVTQDIVSRQNEKLEPIIRRLLLR